MVKNDTELELALVIASTLPLCCHQGDSLGMEIKSYHTHIP